MVYYFTVMDFTIQLVETGVENDDVLALIIFSLQYVLVNHDVWTYRVKDARWKVTLKVHLCVLVFLLVFLFNFMLF